MSVLADGINALTQTRGRRVREGTPRSAAPGFDPSAHTVSEVQAYLADHPDQADRILAAELTGKARTTLIGE